MAQFQLFGRASVRNAPRLVASELVGAELGSPLRRFGAFVVDLLLWALTVLPALIAIGLALLVWQLGGWDQFRVVASEESDKPAAVVGEAKLRFLRLIEQRKPEALPESLRAALAAEDEETLLRLAAELPVSVSVEITTGEVESRWNEETGELEVANDILFGRRARWVKFGIVFLVGYTLVPWLFRGRSPGKWLFGLRVVRTDAGAFTLWTAFSRAGGYLGSAGMLGLGFLEALWDPNRQAAHDKLADTLVVRAPRFKRPDAAAS